MVSPGHVLHVSQPTAQGVMVVIEDYVSLLVERGWRVSLLCPGPQHQPGELAEHVRDNDATVIEWDAKRSPGSSVAKETLELRRIVRDLNPDVVHLHSSKAGLDGRLAIRGKLPTLFSPHAWSFFHGGTSIRRAALAWERAGQRWTSTFVCGSADELSSGREAGLKTPAVVIPNTVSVGSAGSLSQVDARREMAPDLDPEAPLVVCVGRLVRQKGQVILLEAWPDIRAAVPDAQLVLAGGGTDHERLAAMAGPGVRITGVIARPDAFKWIRAADVVAAPSRWESMSLAVLEAVALGRPVVASDVQGMREAVTKGAGDIVPVNNRVALAAALIPYLKDRAKAAAEGQIAAAESAAKWSRQMSDNGDALVALYRKTIVAHAIKNRGVRDLLTRTHGYN